MRPVHQRGLTTVEFAFVGATAMVVLFAVLEFSRMMFVYNALNEATRRGARIAAVCDINDPAIREVATYNTPGAGEQSPIVHGLEGAHFNVQYLAANGTAIANPNANFSSIRYVRVRLQNFRHTLLIPGFNFEFDTPEFASTLPRESLGRPRFGTMDPC